MRILISVVFAGLLFPGAAYACGGGPDFAASLFLASLFLLMLPAYLMPLAGIFAIGAPARRTYATLFFGYAAVCVGAAASGILLDLTHDEASILTFLGTAMLAAPSMHYIVCAVRTGCGNAERGTVCENAQGEESQSETP